MYGRKTLETFKDQKLLPNRTNIIMSRNYDFKKEGAVIMPSAAELEDYLRMADTDEVYLIGGASLYNSLIDLCDKAIITYIHKTFTADAYFPNLDKDPDWEITADSEEQVYFDLTYHFLRYERKKK